MERDVYTDNTQYSTIAKLKQSIVNKTVYRE